MMLDSKLIRYLAGQVEFKAHGENLEKFVNIAHQAGLQVEQLYYRDEILYGQIPVRQYRILTHCAKQCSVVTKVIQKKGFPFVCHRYRKRWGMIVGICFFLIFLLTSQKFVWRIQIESYDEKKSAYLLQVMEKHGLHKGAYIPNLNMRQLKQQVLMEVSDLAWITFNLEGSTVYVDLSQKTQMPDIDPNTPCNVIAKKTGQILSMDVLNGEGVVKLKQIVSAGDLLISGINPVKTGDVLYQHAEGKVIAQTINQHTLTFPLVQQEHVSTGETTDRYYLEFFGLKIPLFIAFDLPYPSEVKEQYISTILFGQEMPFGIYRNTHHFYLIEQKQYTQEEAKQIIDQNFKIYEQNELKDAKIIDYTEEITVTEETLYVARKYTCEEDIAQKVGLYINE